MSFFGTITEQVISQVKSRPVLWDKKDEMYGNIQAMDYEWNKMSAILKRDKEFLKKRWRRVRDVFRIELKKLKAPEKPSQPLLHYYSGVWPHFENMLFLKDSLSKRTPRLFFPEEIEAEVAADNCLTQESILHQDASIAQESLDKEEAESEPGNYDVEDDEFHEKPLYVNVESWAASSKENTGGIKRKAEDWEDVDEDVNFAKSIVGYLRRLNPIRKLLVRNEIQNILLRELLCDKCRCKGQSKACQCE